MIFLLVKISINISWYFVYILSLLANKSLPTLNIQQKPSKTSYNKYRKLVNMTIKFSSVKSFFDLPIFTNKKDSIVKQ